MVCPDLGSLMSDTMVLLRITLILEVYPDLDSLMSDIMVMLRITRC